MAEEERLGRPRDPRVERRAGTEAANPRTRDLDTLEALDIVRLMNEEDATVADAVRTRLPVIAEAVDAIAARLRSGGRLVYVGAGTSGRLAVLDAAECVPTFGTPPGLVQAVIAGGTAALTRSVEGAEDDDAAGARDLAAVGIGADDAVVGIAASGTTPYVLGAMREARARGALLVGVSCNAPAPLLDMADHPIDVLTGPEVIAGSTRLKAGTAQKLVLNMLSTAAMVRLGKVHGNLMVDVAVTNRKLRRRAVAIVAELSGASEGQAGSLLDAAGQDVKTAVVMGLTGLGADAARAAVADAGGRLREALAWVGRGVSAQGHGAKVASGGDPRSSGGG